MKQAQAAIEFLLVIALSLVLVIPALTLFFNFTQDTTYEALNGRVSRIGTAMVETTQSVYYYGNEASKVLVVDFPSKVNALEINPQNKHEIIFTLEVPRGTTEAVFYSEIPLQGNFTQDKITQGPKQFKFENVNGTIMVSELDVE